MDAEIKSLLYILNHICKKVDFNDEFKIIEEPKDLQKALQKSRQSDYFQRQLDKLRMNNLLAPILNAAHREKIWLRNQQHNR